MTLRFCSFDREPLIKRIYGTAGLVYPLHADRWRQHMDRFGHRSGTRQFYELDITSVQTSCGFGAPYYDYAGERPTLASYLKRDKESLIEYWATNEFGIDGKPTAIISDV